MDVILDMSLPWVQQIQTFEWLEWPMRAVTRLGSEAFFLLFLSFIYWCVNPFLGLRIAMILLVSTSLNSVLKLAFIQPRPYWQSATITPYALESSFGLPSGHAQNSLAVWGRLAQHYSRDEPDQSSQSSQSSNKQWPWWLALGLIGLIGLSRVYLGVHFPTDVLVGWGIAALLLLLFRHFEPPIHTWINHLSPVQQWGWAVGTSVLLLLPSAIAVQDLALWQFPADWQQTLLTLDAGPLPEPVSIKTAISAAGSWFGFRTGAIALKSRQAPHQWFQPKEPVTTRLLHYISGLTVAIAIWAGLDAIFPNHETLLAYGLRYCRYGLLGLWITAGAPMLFERLRPRLQP